ncbi:probable LRR receptor-like serine/threonine-protein kinase RKF3 [Mercurialis annua]|uniref:probable LRR receptor-like serine/threonine-protein kinase RKF3 n=1 Tax=Mercurialis annua TaxID=3986 RepID=UPI00215EA9AD|nr:probable LRR receptor-like serine/threonine-protein kinase RKF3 [Mercurialis annua]
MSLCNSLIILFKLFLCLSLAPISHAQPPAVASCPLNFTILSDLITDSKPANIGPNQECQYIKNGLRLVESHYLQQTNSFLPPLNSAESCWRVYQNLVDRYIANFDVRSSCGYNTSWISQGCMNITTRSQFEALIPNSSLNDVARSCNQPLENNSPCAACTASLSRQQASYLTGKSVGNLSDCLAYPAIYAGAFLNRFGPADRGTAKCLFLLDFETKTNRKNKKVLILILIFVILGVGLLVIVCGYWFIRRKYGGLRKIKRKRDKLGQRIEMGGGLSSGLESISESTNLVRFKFDEIKEATRNFSRDNIIGRGGYGNVYKGVLPDGTQVAFKRFKNLTAAGDSSFVHEVEVIASVRHVNLVALRGYCTASTPFEGHQRVIVCDLMKNGSLYDHLFGGVKEKLSWPIRQKIALGTAKGLAYLHYAVQPGIIHRDIKASNILLDDNFEPKVADFGLAKFTPEGATHLSTRVAGTMGYVAPEYALYGQLTERSDVYSFGVVLLELLSGKKALVMTEDSQPALVTDWAWSLVRKGRILDVVEDGMPDLIPGDVVEKYILVGLLCSHPQLHARPTMDQVVKMLEMDQPIPTIPERPIPLVAEMDDIERSVSSCGGSGQLSTSGGYQLYSFENNPGTSFKDERHSFENTSGSSFKDERLSSDTRPVELL